MKLASLLALVLLPALAGAADLAPLRVAVIDVRAQDRSAALRVERRIVEGFLDAGAQVAPSNVVASVLGPDQARKLADCVFKQNAACESAPNVQGIDVVIAVELSEDGRSVSVIAASGDGQRLRRSTFEAESFPDLTYRLLEDGTSFAEQLVEVIPPPAPVVPPPPVVVDAPKAAIAQAPPKQEPPPVTEAKAQPPAEPPAAKPAPPEPALAEPTKVAAVTPAPPRVIAKAAEPEPAAVKPAEKPVAARPTTSAPRASALVSEPPAKPKPSPPPAKPRERAVASRGPLPGGPWPVLASGVVLAGLSGGFAMNAATSQRILDSRGDSGPRSARHAAELEEAVARDTTIAVVLGVASAVGLGAGVFLLLPSDYVFKSVVVTPTGTGLSLSGTF